MDGPDTLSDALKQKVAGEMNLSETAFVWPSAPPDEGAGRGSFVAGSKFGLRWFTPTNEVPLCGHATLATASVLLCFGCNVRSVDCHRRLDLSLGFHHRLVKDLQQLICYFL